MEMVGHSYQHQEGLGPKDITENPLTLVEVLKDYGVYRFGAFYIYLPLPHLSAHAEVWVWFQIVKLRDGVILDGPWSETFSRAKDRLEKSHPKLFVDGEVAKFDTYRLNEVRLKTLVNGIG